MLVHSIQSLRIAQNVSELTTVRRTDKRLGFVVVQAFPSGAPCNVFARENAMLKLPKRGENALN